MNGLRLLIVLGLLSACTTGYTDYYYGKENLRWFICGWDHYIVVEDLGDSLKIWNLDDECNAGYSTTDNAKIPKKVGVFERIKIEKITEEEIKLKLDRGHEETNFNLSRQTKPEKSLRVVNIIQMLEIDRKMEQYIQASTSKAKSNTLYLTENYIADDKVEELEPAEFSRYYSDKKMSKAQTIIKELEDN